MILDFDHVQLAIPTGAEAAARAFYGGVLQLREIEKPVNLRARGGVWYSLGSRQLHLGTQSDFIPTSKAHPAFLVDGLAELEVILQSAGYPIIRDEQLPGFDRFYSVDPFRNTLEFLTLSVDDHAQSEDILVV